MWNEWAGNSLWSRDKRRSRSALTLEGVPYHFLNNGGELMFFRDAQVASGSVNILAAFQWPVSQGLVKSTDVRRWNTGSKSPTPAVPRHSRPRD